MKKRIFAIVMCLCLALTALQAFELSFEATAAVTPPAGTCICPRDLDQYTSDHNWGCPCKSVNICTECGYLVDLPGYNSTLFPTSHYKYCEENPNKPTALAIPSSFMEITAANANYVNNNAHGVDQYTKEPDLRSNYPGYRIFVLTVDMWADNETADDMYVPENQKVVIDLNGHKFRGTGEGSVITNYGTLVIEDSNPNSGHEGVMHGRGYYYFDDEGGVNFKETRYAKDVLWVQGSTYEDGQTYNDKFPGVTMPSSEKTPAYGGIIHGGRTIRNVDPGKTYEDLFTANISVNNPSSKQLYYAHFVQGFKYRGSSRNYGRGGGGIYNAGTLTMNGGTIVGNESYHGEGSAVYNKGASASFTMNGGKIMYNFGKSTVANSLGAKFTFNAGTIFRNVNIGNGAV